MSARCPDCGHDVRTDAEGHFVPHDVDGLEPNGPGYWNGDNAEVVGHLRCCPSPSPRGPTVKVRRVGMRFQRQLDVSVLVPLDATEAQIQAAANKTLGSLKSGSWWLPDWTVELDTDRIVQIPEGECAVHVPRLLPVPVLGAFAEADAVLSDGRDDLVNPVDATWWIRVPAAAGRPDGPK